ncbi:TrkA family potassium uptake protein [Lujinxingia vulgaris]|uniref:TrkA family potassium uptake protein n=1 Tax=Lujinxingia vulgaris TaxID=2600176 RepID=A0A5C6X9F0_9DELT|nr:TrkA family potassium uptake protein [Lujinxingia vulgaris]TXD38451.1 TrkA family potassium uptake protein [Lujinxingia vulgaris]
MAKQALIIGLGQFGMALARSLTGQGVDVLAVDTKEELVQQAAGFAAEGACFNAMDEEALARAAPDRRDICVCAIGDESREGAIVVTALLRKMGAPRVVARATDELLERILHLVGAHEVVNPERAFGERLATRMLYSGVLEEVPLGEDLVLTELRPPEGMLGRSLKELQLPTRVGVNVVAIRRVIEGRGIVQLPEPDTVLQTDDILVVVSRSDAARQLVDWI